MRWGCSCSCALVLRQPPHATPQPLPEAWLRSRCHKHLSADARTFDLEVGCDGNQTRPVEQTVSDGVVIYGGAETLLSLVSAVVAVLLSALGNDPHHGGCDFGGNEKCCNISTY